MKLYNIILHIGLILFMITGAVFYPDTSTYADPVPLQRTIGFPFLLDLFSERVVILNCVAAAWMIYVLYRMIGFKVAILLVLGYPLVYVPNILPDVIFASLVVTSIWHLKEKRLWWHFIFLGLASLFKPNLAWYFVIEPLVFYFYGYRGRWVVYSFVLAFVATAATPLKNLLNHGVWIHSSIMAYNIEHYYTGVLYFIEAFKGNWIAPHYGRWLFIGANMSIWIWFCVRVVQRKINWGDVVILLYFLIPTLFANTGARMRLPVEWILLM